MISVFILLLFYAIGAYSEPTRVFNAKARSPDGNHGPSDMQIQVIQVGLVNFDEDGQPITQPPVPVTVHTEIRHRVKWSPETGVVVKEKPPEDNSNTFHPNRREEPLLPSFISDYFSRATAPSNPISDSELFIITVLVLCIGLSAIILLAYLVNLCLQRSRKKHETIITRKIIYRPQMELISPPPRPILYEHEYENLSDLDEAATYEPLPPPIPPRKKRLRPPLHLVLDQPVTWLLEKPSSESSYAPSLVKQKTRAEEQAERRRANERRRARRIRRGSF